MVRESSLVGCSFLFRLIKRTDRSGGKKNGVYYSSLCPIILLYGEGRGTEVRCSVNPCRPRRHIKIKAASLVRGFRFISVEAKFA